MDYLVEQLEALYKFARYNCSKIGYTQFNGIILAYRTCITLREKRK